MNIEPLKVRSSAGIFNDMKDKEYIHSLGFIPLILIMINTIIVLFSLVLVLPGESEASSSDYRRTDITTLVTNGGRVEWGPDGEWIYYDRKETDDYYYDVHRVRPDGTEDSCLTCDHPDLPNRHQGNPAMHPLGRWLLFQAEKPSHYQEDWDYNPCKPGGGYFNDLYVMDLESSPPYDVYPLTDVSSVLSPPGGSLHAHFSHDGSRLLWGDLEGYGGRFGDWRMAVADFKTDTSPYLDNHSYYNPGDNPLWFETHDWQLGDARIIFAAAPLGGMDDFAGDICRMDFSDPATATRLTSTSGTDGETGEWDEHAHISPLDDAIAWMSSNGYGIHPEDPDWRSWVISDIWLMNPDGSGKKQVTFFNVTGHSDYVPGEVVCADNSWSPDGSKLAVTWYHRGSGATQIKIIHFTGPSTVSGGDYNGDGTADIAIFRENSGLWAVRGTTRSYFGTAGDLPVAGDYDGDGTTGVGIFRPGSGLWALREVSRVYFGGSNDLPVPGDYDGDGSCDIGIFRDTSGLWAIRGVSRVYFGQFHDRAVPGDYDGDGTQETGIFRPSSGLWALRGVSRAYFGQSYDRPVPGDYDGDGAWETGVFRPAAGLWAIKAVSRYYFGGNTSSPVPADFNGDEADDAGVFHHASGLWAIRGVSRAYYGTVGDMAVTR